MTLHPHKTGGLITVQIHTNNQKEVDRCIKKLSDLLKKNSWRISDLKVKGLVFRACPYGSIKIPLSSLNGDIYILGNENSAEFPPSVEELPKNFPDSVWIFSDAKDVFNEEKLLSEIEKAIAEQMREEKKGGQMPPS